MDTSSRISSIWRRIFSRDHLDLNDEFFSLGGSSMQVIEMLAEVSELYPGEIDYMSFLKDARLGRLVEMVEDLQYGIR